MTPAQTERAKLLAGWFERASTSCLTVGVFAPVAGAIYIPPEHPPALWVYGIGALIWLSAAIALHLFARIALGGLDMSDLQLFAFVILPILVVIGAGVLLLIERRTWRVADAEPDLFEQPRARSLANSEGLKHPTKARRAD